MRLTSLIDRVFQQEDINFVLTNRIPRRLLTSAVGWFSRVENGFVRDLSIATMQRFAGDLGLHEAKKARFTSLHDCFVRELKEGARPIDRDPRVLVSPCDAIVGRTGTILGNELLQAKGSEYRLDELFGGTGPIERYRDGRYATLRLTSSMYHRFHAPADCAIHETTYISGDTWNVNPIALKRIARLYCKNERAVLHARLDDSGADLALVAVGAILVASVHLNFVNVPLTLKYRGPNHLPCRASFRKGDELGYFHHGSTIIVVAPAGFDLSANVREGERIRMGQPLLRTR
jgi:phosphatidylserine decarboxylase